MDFDSLLAPSPLNPNPEIPTLDTLKSRAASLTAAHALPCTWRQRKPLRDEDKKHTNSSVAAVKAAITPIDTTGPNGKLPGTPCPFV